MKLKNFIIILLIYSVPQCLGSEGQSAESQPGLSPEGQSEASQPAGAKADAGKADASKATPEKALSELTQTIRARFDKVQKFRQQNPASVQASVEFYVTFAELEMIRALSLVRNEILTKIYALKTQISQGAKG